MPAALKIRHGAPHMWRCPDLADCLQGLWCQGLPVQHSSALGSLANLRRSACYPLLPCSNRFANAQRLVDKQLALTAGLAAPC